MLDGLEVFPLGLWRDGSASDSRSEGWEFEVSQVSSSQSKDCQKENLISVADFLLGKEQRFTLRHLFFQTCTSERRFSESIEKAKALSTEPVKWSKGASNWPCSRFGSWQERNGELKSYLETCPSFDQLVPWCNG